MEIPSRRRRAGWLAASTIAIATCGCGSSHHPTGGAPSVSSRALLLAYGAPFVDRRHGDAVKVCHDFAPAAARQLVVFPSRSPASAPGRLCLATLGRRFRISGQRGRHPGFGLRQALLHIGITRVQGRGASATAVIDSLFDRRPGSRSISR